MPYLRFSRDERGYENTYILHTYRRDGRSYPSLLYWFRTPPKVKVGRLPLNPDAIRAIEENNPDLAFDWTKILKVKPVPVSGDRRTGKSSTSGRVKRGRRSGRREVATGAEAATECAPALADEGAVVTGAKDTKTDREAVPKEGVGVNGMKVEVGGGDTEVVNDEVESPAGDTLPIEDEGDVGVADADGQHPLVTLMGDEVLARVRARYAEIQVRISEKFKDASKGDEIRARAEGLNPDGWVTIEEAVRGIETLESETEAIRRVLGRRRPRTRRGGDQGATEQSGSAEVESS